MSISSWQSSAQAENYFQQDLDYYQKNQELGEWHITGEMSNRYQNIAHQSAITKESYQDFADLINQNLKGNATGNQRAGFDITFSPSKSIDVIYAVANDELKKSILQAQDRAVNLALEKASRYITYRMRNENGREHFQNNGLAIAKFQHLSNRNEEIKIHTHCFIANQTINSKGELVSIDNKQLYDNQKLITQIYHQELFQEMQKLGFQSEVLDIQKDILEIKGVTQEARNSISTRTAEIEKWLLENRKELLRKYPNANESQLRQIATLETRNYKQSHSYSELEEIELKNKNLVENTGFTKETIHQIQNLEKSNQKILSLDELTQKAAQLTTEHESTFTSEEILSRAIKLNAIQSYTYDLSTLENAVLNSDIIKLDENIYTTQEMINIEREILTYAQESKNTAQAETTLDKAEQFLSENFSTMTAGQKEAFSHVLTSKDAILGIQGDAGVGKTFMLKAVKEFQKLHKKDNLIGLAPTNKAADEISKESGIKGQTIDSFIHQRQHKQNQIIIVDEASMVDSRKMQKLTDIAQQTNSKLVLMGDTKQFTSIGAGAIFEQLQAKGAIEVAVMAESMRAKTADMKELYKLTKEQKTDAVLDILESKNQFQTIEAEDYSSVVKEYLQDKDNTLLLVMKNQTRQELNELIRDELKKDNSISSHQILHIQEKQQLDSISVHHYTSYEVGDMVQQAGSYKGSLKSGTEAVIASVNEELNSITLQDAKGNSKEVNLGEHGDKLNLYKTTQKEFSQNDKIIFTKKDKSLGLNNGDIGTVKEIKDGFLTVDTGKKEIKINTKEYNYIDHAYAITNHKAQGQTSERSIFVGDSRLSSQNAFYVALTRAKAHISIYTQDKEQFRDAVAERQVKRSTLDYNTEEILKRRANELTKIQGLHKSSDRSTAREQKTINLLHKLSNSVVVSNIKRLSDLLLQSDTLNNLANRFRRDANITVRPEINVVGRTQQPTIQIKGESMQTVYDKRREENAKYQEATQEINNQEGEKQNLAREQEKESFIDKIDKASELYERVEDIQRYLSDETGIKDIITSEQDLGVLEDMALNYDMREITQEALESFKHLAQDVVEVLENPTLEIFKDAMHKAVDMSNLFDKQLKHTREIENER
ncbi:MobF family relaxase [Sulfurimonas denitrificans]|nr:MobF family relaxase [Sulfurimonas denitrificans]